LHNWKINFAEEKMATQFNRKTFLTEAEKKPSVSYWAKEDAGEAER